MNLRQQSQNRQLRSATETLEQRQLLAFTAEFDFQPWYTRVPGAEQVPDIGFPYQKQGDRTFGWNHWKAVEMVDRDFKPTLDRELSTYVKFDGWANEEDVWEVAVPNGSYSVTLSAGDTRAFDSYLALDVEQVPALRGVPTKAQPFITRTVTVEVNDGRLTVMGGHGAYKNKLNSISIAQIDSPIASPTNVSARMNANSTARLTWNPTSSRVDGYVIQQTEDDVNWRAVAYPSGTATSITLSNIDTTVNHGFRVFAYRGSRWSPASAPVYVAALDTPTPLPTPAPTPTPTPVPTPPSNPAPVPTQYFDGVTVNPEYDPATVVAALRPLGVNAVRLWGNFEYGKFVQRNWMNAARQYHNLGFHVTLVLQEEQVPTYEQAKAYFSFAVAQPGIADAVDRWEILNEPNFGSYWKGTYTQYVQNVLKPAYEVLKANGETVVGAAPGVFTDAAQYLKDAGYLNYVDFANYHPYGDTAEEQIARIEQVKRIFAGKPLTLTEWNLMPFISTHKKWTDELKEVRSYITRNVESAFYYHFTFTSDWASTGALFKSDAGGYQPNGIFYETYDGFDIKRAIV